MHAPQVRETKPVPLPTQTVTLVKDDATGEWTVGVQAAPLPSIFRASSLSEAFVGIRRRIDAADNRVPVGSDVDLF